MNQRQRSLCAWAGDPNLSMRGLSKGWDALGTANIHHGKNLRKIFRSHSTKKLSMGQLSRKENSSQMIKRGCRLLINKRERSSRRPELDRCSDCKFSIFSQLPSSDVWSNPHEKVAHVHDFLSTSCTLKANAEATIVQRI